MSQKKPIFIAIAGGSASGKTYFSNILIDALGKEKCTYLSHDRYYKEGLDPKTTNYDHPASIDSVLFKDHLRLLEKNTPIEAPIYDYVSHSRKEYGKVVPNEFIIVDGILILHDSEIIPIFEIAVFIDASATLRLERRIKRDVKERGRTPESVISQFNLQVEPMHSLYVEKQRRYCKYIVYEGFDYNKMVEIITKDCMARK